MLPWLVVAIMTFREKLFYQQIHPITLSTDIAASIICLFVYWQHYFFTGIAVRYVPYILATSGVLAFADVKSLKESRFGCYIQKNLTRTEQIIQFLSNFIMLAGAWYHIIWVIILGVVLIIGCWIWGLVLSFFSKNNFLSFFKRI